MDLIVQSSSSLARDNTRTTRVPYRRPDGRLTMAGILSHFRIEALHNRHTIDVPITDNKLVLIGENGTGKSTVTNFIYFFLTRQWRRLLSYEFRRVVATIISRRVSSKASFLSFPRKQRISLSLLITPNPPVIDRLSLAL
jgi:ABC-type branched-subunit amino acid transport system ATPase component